MRLLPVIGRIGWVSPGPAGAPVLFGGPLCAFREG